MMEAPMAKPYDLSKPLVALDHDSTLVAVVEMSGTSWLVLAICSWYRSPSATKAAGDENRRSTTRDLAPGRANAMVQLLAKVRGIGIETAEMLVHEVLSRNLRDRRAVARYAGLTGTPDESGRKRRERGSAEPATPGSVAA